MMQTALRNKEIEGSFSGMTDMTISRGEKGTYRILIVFVALGADSLFPPALMADFAR
jgi:hypothetical protein